MHTDLAGADLVGELGKHRIEHRVQFHVGRVHVPPFDVCVREQIVDERRHLQRTIANADQVGVDGFVDRIAKLLAQQMCESIDRAQRSFQIVGDRVRKPFELTVGTFELRRALCHPLLQCRVQIAITHLAVAQVAHRFLQAAIGKQEFLVQPLRIALNQGFARTEDHCEHDEHDGGPAEHTRRQRRSVRNAYDDHGDDQKRRNHRFEPALAQQHMFGRRSVLMPIRP